MVLDCLHLFEPWEVGDNIDNGFPHHHPHPHHILTYSLTISRDKEILSGVTLDKKTKQRQNTNNTTGIHKYVMQPQPRSAYHGFTNRS